VAARAAGRAMGGGEAMAVIGIGTNSRTRIEDVLAIVAAAEAKLQKAPSPLPLSRGGRGESPLSSSFADNGRTCGRARPAPSPLAGEGWGEGEEIRALACLGRDALNRVPQEAARRLGLDLKLLSLDQLRAAAHLCVTHSEKSMQQYGIPSIAEAAALAAAGPGARLLLPRFCGRNATASVAALP
jgi:Cobalamin synthesis G C-terminus